MSLFTLIPLHECLGLAVIGIDLSAPLDPDTHQNLRRLLAEHLVLVFPGQSLSAPQYLAAAAAFGPPMRPHPSPEMMPGFPDIGLLGEQEARCGSNPWRTDFTGCECPPAATMLYGVEIPPAEGATSIADMRAAYWGLAEPERLHLETLRTVNSIEPQRSDAGTDEHAQTIHPMVRTHPLSRERAVYIHPSTTLYIEGMTREASRAYLADLIERMIQPEIVYRHSWRQGDVLVIDNRATLHRADDQDARGDSRLLWRILIEGERPVLV